MTLEMEAIERSVITEGRTLAELITELSETNEAYAFKVAGNEIICRTENAAYALAQESRRMRDVLAAQRG